MIWLWVILSSDYSVIFCTLPVLQPGADAGQDVGQRSIRTRVWPHPGALQHRQPPAAVSAAAAWVQTEGIHETQRLLNPTGSCICCAPICRGDKMDLTATTAITATCQSYWVYQKAPMRAGYLHSYSLLPTHPHRPLPTFPEGLLIHIREIKQSAWCCPCTGS